jgi:Leucine-rich repeat (LRR) protein
LTELPTEIGKLKSLEVLSIENNALKEVPAELYQLQNLKTLNLRDNQIPLKDIVEIHRQFPLIQT